MDKKTRIFFLIPVLKGGGAERNIINLISNLDKDVYDIGIIAGNIGGNLESSVPKEIKIINLKCSNLLSLFIKLCGCLRVEQPDILVSALPHINTISMMAKTFSGVTTKIVLTEHTTFSLIPSTARTLRRKIGAQFILPHFMRFFYPFADAIVCVSHGVAEDLRSVVGNLKTIQVIYNPVVDEKIYHLAKESLGSDDHLFNVQGSMIIAVGRLIKAKDYPTLLKAYKLVLKDIPVNLVILGEGPEENNVKSLASSLGISPQVHFLGFQPNPYKYMAHASVFVLSSIREGFGNVIVEAMACNTPVVATDCKSGPGEIIQDGVNGLLVPPQNEKALSGAIIKILHDPVLAKKLSDEGLKRAQYFSIEKSVGEYDKVFKQLISKSIA